MGETGQGREPVRDLRDEVVREVDEVDAVLDGGQVFDGGDGERAKQERAEAETVEKRRMRVDDGWG